MRIQSTNNYYLQSKNNNTPNFGKLIITEKAGNMLKDFCRNNAYYAENLEKFAKEMEDYKYYDVIVDENGGKIISKKHNGLELSAPFEFSWLYLNNALLFKTSGLDEEYIINFEKPGESGHLMRLFNTVDTRLEKTLILAQALEKSERINEKTGGKKENLVDIHNKEKLLLSKKIDKLLKKYGV